MFSFAIDYFLLVLVAGFGAIQLAASAGGLGALLIFKPVAAARAFGLVLMAVAFVWFFAPGERNINDYEGGLDANQQALLFVFGALAAVAATLVAGSLRNARMRGEPAAEGGLDALRHTSYARALVASLRYWRSQWRTRTRPYFFG